MIIAISGKIGSGKDTVGRIIQYLVYNQGVRTPLDVILALQKFQTPEDEKVLAMHSGWQVRKFADKLKEICSLLTGIPRADFEKQEVKDSFLGDEWTKKHLNWIWEEQLIEYAKADGKTLEEFFDSDVHELLCQEKDGRRCYRMKYLDEKRTVRWLLQNVGTEAMRNHIHPEVWVNALFADYKVIDQEARDTANGPEPELVDVYPNWIITDMRFPNELQSVKQRGGLTIRLERHKKIMVEDYNNVCPCCLSARVIKQEVEGSSMWIWDYTCKNCQSTWQVNRGGKMGGGHDLITITKDSKQNHPSETALDNGKFDYVIDNNNGREELVRKVREILIKEKIIK